MFAPVAHHDAAHVCWKSILFVCPIRSDTSTLNAWSRGSPCQCPSLIEKHPDTRQKGPDAEDTCGTESCQWPTAFGCVFWLLGTVLAVGYPFGNSKGNHPFFPSDVSSFNFRLGPARWRQPPRREFTRTQGRTGRWDASRKSSPSFSSSFWSSFWAQSVHPEAWLRFLARVSSLGLGLHSKTERVFPV